MDTKASGKRVQLFHHCSRAGCDAIDLEKDDNHFKLCSRCRIQRYCCKNCQVADWEHHKIVCSSDELFQNERLAAKHLHNSVIAKLNKEDSPLIKLILESVTSSTRLVLLTPLPDGNVGLHLMTNQELHTKKTYSDILSDLESFPASPVMGAISIMLRTKIKPTKRTGKFHWLTAVVHLIK